jgi:hypothetical protein
MGNWLDKIKGRLGRISPADPNDFPRLIGGWYVEDVPRLVTEVERLRGLLKRLEWAGPAPMVPRVGCPACRRWRTGATRPGGVPDGHDPEGCWLAEEIRS